MSATGRTARVTGAAKAVAGSVIGIPWAQLGRRFLPFADAATDQLPLGRLLRLSLFQLTVGMAVVLLNGTLNRVMIVELGVPVWLVALMIALPLVFAPLRALIGYRSDMHRSVLGWRRVPYLWFGSLLQFGGLAIMPFALFLLSGDQTVGPDWAGEAGAALAFLMVGAGLHTTQTAGLALATDLAPPEARPRVVALLYVTLLAGMVLSAFALGALLADYSPLRLIQVVQGAAALTLVVNLIALWKQEPRNKSASAPDRDRPPFWPTMTAFLARPDMGRVMLAVGLGTAGFNMQDALLEPYGGQVMGLGVGATTALTGVLSIGALVGFAVAARALSQGVDAYRLSGFGALAGLPAFSLVIFAGPMQSLPLLQIGAACIGFGAGLFAVGTLTAAMALAHDGQTGLALGAWGAVQATAAGGAIALGGLIRDGVSSLAAAGALGPAFNGAAAGYTVVYHLELLLLFATLVAIGPLVRAQPGRARERKEFGLAEFPS